MSAKVVSPTVHGPIAAANTARVPHSAPTTSRTCGNAALPSPRPDPGRPKNAAFSGVSGTSSVVPSTATTRHPRYHTPGVSAPATGRHTRANNAFNGSGPNRTRAREIAAVVGTSHRPRHRRAHASPQASSRATSS